MTTSVSALDGLKRERPEWVPWLAVIEEVLRETNAGTWDAAVPGAAHSGADAPAADAAAPPLLAGVALSVQSSAVRSLVKRLIRIAAAGGTPKMKTLEALLDPDLDVLTMFSASLRQDGDRVTGIADVYGADAEALQAVAALVPVPFLQACNRRWASSIPRSWTEGYCPVCGSWPAFAEVRGIERSRYCRCGRCGGQWHAETLCCPYCAMADHNELVSLVPEKNDAHAVIEACRRCRGYVKTFTRLQGCASDTVIVEDLASVALDVAALDQGYRRPPGAGYSFDVTVVDAATTRRFFAWNA
jgi:FdhE protein